MTIRRQTIGTKIVVEPASQSKVEELKEEIIVLSANKEIIDWEKVGVCM